MEKKNVLLSVKDLEVKFRVRGRILSAIRGVSLDIYEDESIAIVGESGAGKSVFTKAFAGMLDSNGFVSNGSIIFNDPELSDTVVKLNSTAWKFIDSYKKQLAVVKLYQKERTDYLQSSVQTTAEEQQAWEKKWNNIQEHAVQTYCKTAQGKKIRAALPKMRSVYCSRYRSDAREARKSAA